MEPDWVRLTLHLNTAGINEPQYRYSGSAAEALAILRQGTFDCIVVHAELGTDGNTGTLPFVKAVRSSGCHDAILCVSESFKDEIWAGFCEADCELLVTTTRNYWESPAIAPMIIRTIARRELARDNRRLALEDNRRLTRERDEAEQLLKQQRQILSDLEGLVTPAGQQPHMLSQLTPADSPQTDLEQAAGNHDAASPLPPEVDECYQEVLRSYVILGSGHLGTEIARLARMLSQAGVSPRVALQLHLERVELLVRGLGTRSTRHVMARADLLALELMIHLGETDRRPVETLRHVPVRRVRGAAGIDLSTYPHE